MSRSGLEVNELTLLGLIFPNAAALPLLLSQCHCFFADKSGAKDFVKFVVPNHRNLFA